MTGGQRKGKKKKNKGASSSGSTSQAEPQAAVEPQPPPPVMEQLGEEEIIYKCYKAKSDFSFGNDAVESSDARKELEALSQNNPNSPHPCHTLSEILVESSERHKTREEALLRRALSWAQSALDRTPTPKVNFSIQHAHVRFKLAMVIRLDDPDKERYLEEALAEGNGVLNFARESVQNNNRLLKRLLDDSVACLRMLTEVKQKKQDESDALDALERLLALESLRSKDLAVSTHRIDSKDDGKVVEEEVIEEKVEKEVEKELKESMLFEVDPPVEWRFALVKYKVTKQWKHYWIGSTSFGEEYEEHRGRPISVLRFDTVLEAKEAFDNLNMFKCDKIVDCYHFSGREVMLELVHSDVESWVNAEYKSFSGGSRTWWAQIEGSFRKIFRDILCALQILFENGAYCGDIINSIAINGKSAKITQVKVARQGGLQVRIWEDIDDLRHLMVTVLLRCYGSDPFNLIKDIHKNSILDSILEEGGVPFALRQFLWNLCQPIVRAKWNVLWLLDEAFFWGDVEKYSFIRKMNEHKRKFEAVEFQMAMETLLCGRDLTLFFPRGSIEDKVYEFGLGQQLQTRKEKELAGHRTYIVLYQDNIFLGVISYFKNLVGHYNDYHPQVRLSTYDIVARADRLFHGGCSIIRNAIANGMCNKHQRGDLGFFLSKVPY